MEQMQLSVETELNISRKPRKLIVHKDSLAAMLSVLKQHFGSSADATEIVLSFAAYDQEASYGENAEALGALVLPVIPFLDEGLAMKSILDYLGERCSNLKTIHHDFSVAVSSNITVINRSGRVADKRMLFIDSDVPDRKLFDTYLAIVNRSAKVLKTRKGFHAILKEITDRSGFIAFYSQNDTSNTRDKMHATMSIRDDNAFLRIASTNRGDIVEAGEYITQAKQSAVQAVFGSGFNLLNLPKFPTPKKRSINLTDDDQVIF